MAGVLEPHVMAPTHEPRRCLGFGGAHLLARTSSAYPGSQPQDRRSWAQCEVCAPPRFLTSGQIRFTSGKSCRRSAAVTARRACVAAKRRRFPASNALVLTAALWIGIEGAQAGAAADQRPVTSLLEMRQDRVVVQQWDLSCGAAALATLLKYQHGDPVPEREIARGLMEREEYLEEPLLVRARQGFSLLDLKRYVDQRGYLGMGYGELTLADLIELAPIIAPVKLNGFNHFVVFRGAWGNRVLLADPAFGNRTMLMPKFEAAWLDYGKIGKVGFVVARLDGARPPNQLAPRPTDFVSLR
jgi:uncharacterized protein